MRSPKSFPASVIHIEPLFRAPDSQLAWQFWREHRTLYHLATEWRVGGNTVCRTLERVENSLVKSGAFALPARPKTGGSAQAGSVVVVDGTEHPVESDQKKQRAC